NPSTESLKERPTDHAWFRSEQVWRPTERCPEGACRDAGESTREDGRTRGDQARARCRALAHRARAREARGAAPPREGRTAEARGRGAWGRRGGPSRGGASGGGRGPAQGERGKVQARTAAGRPEGRARCPLCRAQGAPGQALGEKPAAIFGPGRIARLAASE